MQTWEMIKELTENPEKKFKSSSEMDNHIVIRNGILVWKNGATFVLNLNIKSGAGTLDCYEWEEVKEPVTWQEALEASISGKTITIEYEGKVYKQESFWKIGCLKLGLIDGFYNGLDRKMFTEGKWYIED